MLIHHPSEFPYVKDKGFVVAPGTEMFVAVDAYGAPRQRVLLLDLALSP